MEAFLTVVIVFLVIAFVFSIRIVPQSAKSLVMRMGKYSRTMEPGFNLIMPFIENSRKVDVRERVIDVPPQEVITKDNVVVTVDAVVYFQVTEPYRAVYNVEDVLLATVKLAQTNLRNVIGDLELDECLTSRDRINTGLRQILDDATDAWGVRIGRVEIQRIDPPQDISAAMSQQMKAERERRAAVLEAEGIKAAKILQAEGERQAKILQAEGEAQAVRQIAEADKFQKLTVAEGEAQAVETVFGAIHNGRATPEVLALKYLEALAKIADGKATKVFLPLEAMGVLGGIAALSESFKVGAADSGAPASPSSE